jgi:hypothetical protein
MRTLHLVDIENLCGSGLPDAVEARTVLDEYLLAGKWQLGDLTVVACNYLLARELFYLLPAELSCQCRVGRRGQDGADRELLLAATSIDAPHRFERIVIGSGDRFFRPLIARCRAAGTRFELVLGRGGLSASLGVGPERVTQLALKSHLV